jgi:hypothetical protein
MPSILITDAWFNSPLGPLLLWYFLVSPFGSSQLQTLQERLGCCSCYWALLSSRLCASLACAVYPMISRTQGAWIPLELMTSGRYHSVGRPESACGVAELLGSLGPA